MRNVVEVPSLCRSYERGEELSRAILLESPSRCTTRGVFRHLLAHLPNILAHKLRDLRKKRSEEQKKSSSRCRARLCEKAASLKALGSVASYLENGLF